MKKNLMIIISILITCAAVATPPADSGKESIPCQSFDDVIICNKGTPEAPIYFNKTVKCSGGDNQQLGAQTGKFKQAADPNMKCGTSTDCDGFSIRLCGRLLTDSTANE
ncbi:MAG: hypothetical protein HC904_16235 [Blastochloris sp.]|nr:hypothetical protein [Blastochloris sp.]